MVIEYIRYRVPEKRSEAFIAAYGRSAEALLASPFLLSYELARCEEEPASFIVRLTWTSTEDHLQKFRGSPEFRRFFAEVRQYVNDIEEMRHYAVLQEEVKSALLA
jgi:quinol monooxygenase YgiN